MIVYLLYEESGEYEDYRRDVVSVSKEFPAKPEGVEFWELSDIDWPHSYLSLHTGMRRSGPSDYPSLHFNGVEYYSYEAGGKVTKYGSGPGEYPLPWHVRPVASTKWSVEAWEAVDSVS